MSDPQLAIVLRPIKRRSEEEWQSATSWLGGLPTIAPQDWPRRDDGEPLHFLAQISMVDLPQGPKPAGLPDTGALAFFGHTQLEDRKLDCAVLHIADPEAHSPCPPPDGTPPVYCWDFRYYFMEARTEAAAPRTFARWPLSAIPGVETEQREDRREALRDRPDLVPLNYHATCKLDGCQRVIEQRGADLPQDITNQEERLTRLRNALTPEPTGTKVLSLLGFRTRKNAAERERATKNIEDAQSSLRRYSDAKVRWDAEAPTLLATLAELRARLAALDPTARMTDADEAALDSAMNAVENLVHGGSSGLSDWLADGVMDLMTGERTVFDRLPAGLHKWLESWGTGWKQPIDHQMFGDGAGIQSAEEQPAHKVMLLQLVSDTRLRWLWGDLGVLQFWILHEDLAAQRWDRAFLTFEGH